MRNRAKCRLCGDIIESFHRTDYVACSCDEISVDGGEYRFQCGAKDFKNFIRIDDLGNEIPIRFEEETKEIEELPPRAMSSSITHYDWVASLILLSSILKAD